MNGKTKVAHWKQDSACRFISLNHASPCTWNYSCKNAECDGAKCSVKQEENHILAVTFKACKTAFFEYKIEF